MKKSGWVQEGAEKTKGPEVTVMRPDGTVITDASKLTETERESSAVTEALTFAVSERWHLIPHAAAIAIMDGEVIFRLVATPVTPFNPKALSLLGKAGFYLGTSTQADCIELFLPLSTLMAQMREAEARGIPTPFKAAGGDFIRALELIINDAKLRETEVKGNA